MVWWEGWDGEGIREKIEKVSVLTFKHFQKRAGVRVKAPFKIGGE